MGVCKQICLRLEDVRKLSRWTGHLPRCMQCRFAYPEEDGQVRCECCGNSLRRTPR